VVGFDDVLLASYVCPPLTTIAQPKVEMGQQAFQMALALMTATDPTQEGFSDITVKGQLVVRQSSRMRAQDDRPVNLHPLHPIPSI
jgi:DNA-binding LacI/PurR family transcriptional regulator